MSGLFCRKCGDDLLPDDPLNYHQACIASCRIEGCDQPPVYENRTLCDSHKGIGLTKLKCSKCGRPHWNEKQAREHTCGRPPQYTPDDMAKFEALGYRRTSRKYGIISRVDRPDWKEFLARKGMVIGPGREGNGADHYRACYSKDNIELGTEFAYLALEVPTSGHDPVGFIPKDQLEQQAADAYAAACAECGRMRTTVEVLPVKPRHKHAVTEYHVLLINGVAVIEFENGTELAGKVYKALGTEPEP